MTRRASETWSSQMTRVWNERGFSFYLGIASWQSGSGAGEGNEAGILGECMTRIELQEKQRALQNWISVKLGSRGNIKKARFGAAGGRGEKLGGEVATGKERECTVVWGWKHRGEGCRDGTWAVTKKDCDVKSDGDDNARLPCGALRSRSLQGWTELTLQSKSRAMRDSVTQAALTSHISGLRSSNTLPTPPCAHENLANAQLLTLSSAPSACPHMFAVSIFVPFWKVSPGQGKQSEMKWEGWLGR